MIYVMLAEGFEEIEALTVVDILRRAEIDVKTVSVYNTETVTGAHNIKVIPDIMLDDAQKECEMIILPGGMPGTLNLQKNKDLESMLISANNSKRYIGAICAAPMIFGQLMFLEGKTATCYPSFENHLKGAKCSLDPVCVDENIITSRGAGTAHEFAFKIVEVLKDKSVADGLRTGMIYE